MSLFMPPPSGPLPPHPALASDLLVRVPMARLDDSPGRDRGKRPALEGLLAFLAARAASEATRAIRA